MKYTKKNSICTNFFSIINKKKVLGMTDKEIATRLKTFRLSKKATQKMMAATFGCAISTYNKYEQGLTVIGTKDILCTYYMGCNINWLLTGEGSMDIYSIEGNIEDIKQTTTTLLKITESQNNSIKNQSSALREAARKTAKALLVFASVAQKNAGIIESQNKMLIEAVKQFSRKNVIA
jgi:transcriptional regulator with XRE-family HTH domain